MAEIAIRNVRKTYGKLQVVHGVDLAIGAGEFVVILGPSGCGKSTLLRMIAGLEAITAGEIAIGGEVVNKREPRERGCAMVFQNYALYPHMTVAENIGYALKVAGLAKAERTARVAAVAASIGLTDFLDRKPGQLSGGQRQRVAMGRAMIREPKVFLYDEPLSNLDARLRVAMRVEIRKLHQRLGTTTLFVTHDQVEAMTLADRIVVMNAGKVEQVGTPQEVYGRPESLFVAGFIGTPGLNLLPGTLDPAAGVVHLEGGRRLAYDRQRWAGAPAGRVLAGFRAEVARLVRPGQGLDASYEFAEELGASRLLHGSLGGTVVVVSVADGRMLQPGETFGIEVAPSEVHLFDAETGRRLPGEARPSSRQSVPVLEAV
ncbi:sn-glycerol-3-phosphate ABC transporter ATP-binding protein UgpC [Mongoliimonas terrestris]|uniref:sn-glycerol-3-phosphate ABC transporter ATP-binding protein UgpC n=1 Tax=Mongoliimonas terrestris TaxID=1709001 RepID=UPI000949771A|nr:sn-glycerol-3-phosphate ABC transporter ATP-binding protein UgpC [Mongoliimonas terrestris]